MDKPQDFVIVDGYMSPKATQLLTPTADHLPSVEKVTYYARLSGNFVSAEGFPV